MQNFKNTQTVQLCNESLFQHQQAAGVNNCETITDIKFHLVTDETCDITFVQTKLKSVN